MRKCFYQIWTHSGHSERKQLWPFLPLCHLEYTQFELFICWDPVLLSFLWRDAHTLSGEAKVKGKCNNEKKKVTTKREEEIWRELRGRTEWSLLNARQERVQRQLCRGSGCWRKGGKSVYSSHHCFIDTQIFLLIGMLISFCIPKVRHFYCRKFRK